KNPCGCSSLKRRGAQGGIDAENRVKWLVHHEAFYGDIRSDRLSSCTRLALRYTHGRGETGSAHNPLLASPASFSNPSSTVSPGAYFRYHQHHPSFTSW